MGRLRSLVGLALLASCATSTSSEPTGGSAAPSEPAPGSSTAGLDIETFDGCNLPPPAAFDEVGSVHTIVAQPEADALAVAMTFTPVFACPGGQVSAQISITNTADHDVTFNPNRGLMLVSSSSGFAKWNLGSLPQGVVRPGEVLHLQLAFIVPPVAPGMYSVFPEGYATVEFEVRANV